MPITYVIDRILQKMTTQAVGLITFEDINHHLDGEERERALGLPELIDARNATTDLRPDQVHRLVRRTVDAAKRIPLGATALVTSDDVVFGMARMYSILLDDVAPVEVFRDCETAIRWLEHPQRNV